MRQLEASLFPYQREGVSALLSQPALLLADDMGLGKTLQAITGIQRLLERREIGSALVVAPAGLLGQWRFELDRWAPGLSVIRLDGDWRERNWKWGLEKQLYLISYESLRGDLAMAMKRPWDLVVLDEAQRIKNREAGVSRACKKLVRSRAWALTGTPLENREDELASVLEFVRPNHPAERLASLRPGPRLRLLQSQLQLRRRKSDVLKDLPPKTLVRLPLTMTAEQRSSYSQTELGLRAELSAMGQRVTLINVLEVISRLKQICNFCPVTGRSSKLTDLKDRLETIVSSGHRALVFSQWTNERFGIDRLARELAGFRPLTYSGSLSLPEREQRIQSFRQDSAHKALLLSLRAGGQGLNLQEASYVIHFDRWWNPAVENQATDRAHRMGQIHPVTVYNYTTLDSIEERIEEILERKRALFAAVVDQVSLDVRKLLSPAELYGLLGLSAPPPARRAEGNARDLEQRVVALLKSNQWQVRVEGGGVLNAERTDELGLPQVLAILCLPGRIRPMALSDFLARSSAARRVIVVTRAARAEAEALGGSEEIYWDEEAVLQLERALGTETL